LRIDFVTDRQDSVQPTTFAVRQAWGAETNANLIAAANTHLQAKLPLDRRPSRACIQTGSNRAW
jgi:hypothetical protein